MNKHMDGKSFDNVTSRIAEVKRLFPEAVKEYGRLNSSFVVPSLAIREGVKKFF